MSLEQIKRVYFIGIGGIGMSALARYFKLTGYWVAGYDRTITSLTRSIESEGIDVVYEDSLDAVPLKIMNENRDHVLIVYTPAVPSDHPQLVYFQKNNYTIYKRSQVLGMITHSRKGIAISGTHGKSTITSMVTHLLKSSSVDCSAFMGAISKNYNTNMLYSNHSDYVVIEADEFDRSFLTLSPEIAVITAIDEDHLDIYKDKNDIQESFMKFIQRLKPEGKLIIKKGLMPNEEVAKNRFTYSDKDITADFHALNVKIVNGYYEYDVATPTNIIRGIRLGLPGRFNLENSIAAIAVCMMTGLLESEIKHGLDTFAGVQRRFDFHIRNEKMIYLDDYAHHPEEIKACINSVRELFPNKKITGIFQPHLYSRTRDFAAEFAVSLNLLDELILLDIYPAREEPIEGLTSGIIFRDITIKNREQCSKNQLMEILKTKSPEILLTMGAGDIDNFVEPIKELFSNK
ncbi:MAG: UDP-N-acetylmuramate--L-alanine ligase [Bacteroidetes bacterium GWF2_38_335]|nr:MAG: UDP-N-acetylmuramate--L-alanine ligase [Bacteroidetes bacterium GWF2_38_335]OFY79677.1 MAG: UDP-N-acetylmuramate--L-alanine ligase [Bacteroidetes bacterium RIFOXYA12_FULL_38_20]HBS88999.1 UDP-N-acetylmuramate--L-alanine ligase [Bacteroidales bacterium]